MKYQNKKITYDKKTTCFIFIRNRIINNKWLNGDGINDLLVITCIENYPDNSLTIYNRWGEVMYQAEGYSNNWDGRGEKNKSDVPDGTYAFIFKAKMGGEEKSLTGSITITR